MNRVYIELKRGETVPVAGGQLHLTLTSKRGKTARIMIEAAPHVRIEKSKSGLPPPPMEPSPSKTE